jgi:hypothetical protein
MKNESLPASVLTKSQSRHFPERTITFNGQKIRVRANVRYDDRCNNGHNTFSITGDYTEPGQSWNNGGSGCIHDEIAAAFPELAPLIKWHLCSSEGPLHYVANATHHATQHGPKSAWVYYEDKANGIASHCVKYCDIGEAQKICTTAGYTMKVDEKTAKEANLEFARSTAIWPDATQEQLLNEAVLMARLPALMLEFKAAVESLGFVY